MTTFSIATCGVACSVVVNVIVYSVFSLIVEGIWLMKSKVKNIVQLIYFCAFLALRWKSYSRQNIDIMAEIMVALPVHVYSTSVVQLDRALIVSKPVPDGTGRAFQPRGRSGDFPTTT